MEQLPEPLLRLDKEDLLRVEQRLQVSKGMKRTSSWTGEQVDSETFYWEEAQGCVR